LLDHPRPGKDDQRAQGFGDVQTLPTSENDAVVPPVVGSVKN